MRKDGQEDQDELCSTSAFPERGKDARPENGYVALGQEGQQLHNPPRQEQVCMRVYPAGNINKSTSTTREDPAVWTLGIRGHRGSAHRFGVP